MNKEQLEKLVGFYKKAVQNKLTAEDFVKELKDAQIALDQSFVQEGRENENLGKYIEELYELEKLTTNE